MSYPKRQSDDLKTVSLKGKMFKVILDIESRTSYHEYESEDSRGTRFTESVNVSHSLVLIEIVPKKEWCEDYWEAIRKTEELMYELECLNRVTQAKAGLDVEFPEEVKPQWSELSYSKVLLTEEEYQLLETVFPSEDVFVGKFYKSKPVGYVYLHTGMRGKYLEQKSVPGITIKKNGFDCYCDLGESKSLGNEAKLVLKKVMEKLSLVTLDEWDGRYMPSQSDLPKETLGDLFKGLDLSL